MATSKSKEKSPWLDAWHDPVANLKAFSSQVCLADLNSDGDYKLLVADEDKHLKIWKGTSIISTHPLLERPSAITAFYTDVSTPMTPAIAVAAGPNIFIYRNLRPYYKFTLPPIAIDPIESDVWKSLAADATDHTVAIEILADARNNEKKLTNRSLFLLSLADADKQVEFIKQQKSVPLVNQTVITCMATLNKDMDEEKAVSGLVVGTEACQICILDPTGSTVQKQIDLPSAPVFISVAGLYSVEYRISVAARDGNVYNIKNGKLLGTVIKLETQPVGLVLPNMKNVVVASMDNKVHSFHVKGSKQWSIYLPDTITNMEYVKLQKTRAQEALLVALANGEVRLYHQKHLVTTIHMNHAVKAMRFGQYGREEGSLVLVDDTGALTIKMLKRKSNLEASSQTPGPPPEQDIPLNVPPITQLAVDQTKREKDQATEMHRIFQRDLCKMRLETARSFVKLITSGHGPMSSTGASSLRLNAQVQGLGPFFKMKLNIRNTGTNPLVDIPVSLSYDHIIYRIPKSLFKIPVLIPGLSYLFEIKIECIDPAGGCDAIRVFICNPNSCVPAISAIVNMPASEILEEEEP